MTEEGYFKRRYWHIAYSEALKEKVYNNFQLPAVRFGKELSFFILAHEDKVVYKGQDDFGAFAAEIRKEKDMTPSRMRVDNGKRL